MMMGLPKQVALGGTDELLASKCEINLEIATGYCMLLRSSFDNANLRGFLHLLVERNDMTASVIEHASLRRIWLALVIISPVWLTSTSALALVDLEELPGLLQRIEQQVLGGHAISPAEDNAVLTWKQIAT